MPVTELDVELYKLLKAENAAYQDKLQALWLQKLTLSGTTVAAIFLAHEQFERLSFGFPVVAGSFLLLILAVTIDVKVLEYGLHLRAISRFLARNLPSGSIAARWEKILWGDADAPERPLVFWRSMLTIISTAIPTIALLLLASIIFAKQIGQVTAIWAGAVVAICYFGTLTVSGWSLFKRASLALQLHYAFEVSTSRCGLMCASPS
jgi:hypothetical protein